MKMKKSIEIIRIRFRLNQVKVKLEVNEVKDKEEATKSRLKSITNHEVLDRLKIEYICKIERWGIRMFMYQSRAMN